MPKRSLANKKTRVDPLFVIPPGSEDEFIYSRDLSDDDIAYLNEELFISDEDGSEDELAVPENFKIVDQKIKRGAAGEVTVDLVVEIENVPGATDYEIQITKAPQA